MSPGRLTAARTATMWWVTLALSLPVLARWSVVTSVLTATVIAAVVAVTVGWFADGERAEPDRCEAPRPDPRLRGDGRRSSVVAVQAVTILGSAVAAVVVAVALSGPYLAAAFLVWLIADNGDARHLFAVAGVIVVLRPAFFGLRLRR